MHDLKINSETAHQFSFGLSEDHHVSIFLQNGSSENNAVYQFIPIFSGDNEEDLWTDLGFSAQQVSRPLNTYNLIPSAGILSVPTPTAIVVIPKSEQISRKANKPITIENVQGIYLLSKELTKGSNTYESRINTGGSQQMIAKPENILEFIQFDKENSTIYYMSI